jgi:hypothetical protein
VKRGSCQERCAEKQCGVDERVLHEGRVAQGADGGFSAGRGMIPE